MRKACSPQPVPIPPAGVARIGHRITALHAQNDAEGCAFGVLHPLAPVIIKVLRRAENAHGPPSLQELVVGELALCVAECRRGIHIVQILPGERRLPDGHRSGAGQDRGNADGDPCPAQLGKAYRRMAAPPHIGHVGFAGAQGRQRQCQVPVKVERVPSQVKMGIK